MSDGTDKADVFIGAHVPADMASKLTLISMSSESSRSSVIRAALNEYLEQMKPTPCDGMVSHLLSEWHKAQTQPGGPPTQSEYCVRTKKWLIQLGIDEPLMKEVHDQLKQSLPK